MLLLLCHQQWKNSYTLCHKKKCKLVWYFALLCMYSTQNVDKMWNSGISFTDILHWEKCFQFWGKTCIPFSGIFQSSKIVQKCLIIYILDTHFESTSELDLGDYACCATIFCFVVFSSSSSSFITEIPYFFSLQSFQ